MISLDSQTLKLAEQKKNFSQWVRATLIKENENERGIRRRFEYTCKECGYYWGISSKSPDNFFYCPNQMKGLEDCTNTKPLSWSEVR